MTKLNDKWKQGKLEEYKRYYCRTVWFEDIFMAKCHNKGQNDEWWTLENEKYSYNNVHHIKDIEVLAEVPSFEQWSQTYKTKFELLKENTKLETENKWYSEQLNEATKEIGQLKEILEKHKKVTAKTQIKNCDLEIINKKLKELLEECKPFIELCNYTPENKRLLEQIVEQIGDK